MRIDQHPPLYYISLRGWIGLFGDGPAAVRLFSALGSVATLPLFYKLTYSITKDSCTAFLALVILVLSPFHIQYGQEARMYALLTLLVTATIYLAWLLWQQPGVTATPRSGRRNGWRRFAVSGGVAVCQAGAMLTHNVTAVFLPLLLNGAVFGLWRGRKGQLPLRFWIGSQLAAFTIWLPWAYPFIVQAQGVSRRFWLQPPTLADLIGALRTFNFAFLPASVPLEGLWLVLLGGLALVGVFSVRPTARWLLLTWLLLPVAGLLLVSLRRPLFHLPSLLPISLSYYLLLASGMRATSAWQRPGRARSLPSLPIFVPPLWALWISIFVVLNGLSLYTYYSYLHKEAWNEAAVYVAQRVQPGNLLLFNASWVQLPFDYYFRELDPGVVRHGLPVDLFDSGELEPPMTAADLPRLRRLSAGREHIWLIYSHHWFTDPQGLIPATLARERNLIEEKVFAGIRIYHFE
jgi:uncharacterized membrane protein